jgi:hypothetical protein
MNVWEAVGARRAYFKVVDEIIIKLFNTHRTSQRNFGYGVRMEPLEHVFTVIEGKR